MDAREAMTDEPDPRAIAAERLTFFADAVIAIAITLLALELPVPEGDTNHAVLHSLYLNRGDYISFVISFYVIGFYWAHHHKVFRFVTVLGGRLVFLTLLWLFVLVLTPFATHMLSGDGGFQVRFVFYAIVQALAGLLWLLMVGQIQRHRLYRADTPPDLFQNAYFGTGGLAVGFLLSIPVAFFAPDQAYDLWIVVPIATALIRRRFFNGPRG
jgi:uncharacterized membrane protein